MSVCKNLYTLHLLNHIGNICAARNGALYYVRERDRRDSHLL